MWAALGAADGRSEAGVYRQKCVWYYFLGEAEPRLGRGGAGGPVFQAVGLRRPPE